MILTYHHVSPAAEAAMGSDTGFGGDFGGSINHEPRELEFHIRELRRRGFQIVSLAELVHDIEEHGREPWRKVALTFDDGWMDNYDYALPVLTDLGAPATFFVLSGHLSTGCEDRRRMGLNEIRYANRQGICIGAHSTSHRELTKLFGDTLHAEIEGCRRHLEAAIDESVDFFAYPGGSFNSETAEFVQRAGYRAAVSSLGPHQNTTESRFWLFRDVLSPTMKTLGDLYRLSRLGRNVLGFRVRSRLRIKLAT